MTITQCCVQHMPSAGTCAGCVLLVVVLLLSVLLLLPVPLQLPQHATT